MVHLSCIDVGYAGCKGKQSCITKPFTDKLKGRHSVAIIDRPGYRNRRVPGEVRKKRQRKNIIEVRYRVWLFSRWSMVTRHGQNDQVHGFKRFFNGFDQTGPDAAGVQKGVVILVLKISGLF